MMRSHLSAKTEIVAALAIVLLAISGTGSAAGEEIANAAEFTATIGGLCSVAATDAHTADTRIEGGAALYELTSGNRPDLAETLLLRQFAAQNMDPDSPQFGAIVNPATPQDSNDTVFAAEAWAPILLRHADRLTPRVRDELRTHAAAALAYVQGHPVDVDYTNIHLLTSSEEVVLAGIFGDATARGRGIAGLQQWIDRVDRFGIHEFDSPPYASIDLDALGYGAAFAADPADRELFARARDFQWNDLAANLFLPKLRIAGAQSRSYDPLTGADDLMSLHLATAGYGARLRDPSSMRCFDIASLLEPPAAASVPQTARRIAAEVPRLVEQRVAAMPWQTKTTFITNDYAIGSSNLDYDGSDRVAAIDFAGGERTQPVMRMIGDETGFWFGPTPKPQRDGGRVWNHAPLRPGVVQRRNIMMVLSDTDGGVPDEGAPLRFGVVLPIAAAVVAGESAIDASQPFVRSLAPGEVVTMSEGGAVAAARIAFAETTAGTDPAPRLEATAASIAHGAAYFAVTQAAATPVASRDLRGITLLGVDSGAGAKTIARRISEATIDQSVSGPTWTVRAHVGGHLLVAVYDLAGHACIERSIDGAPVAIDAPLSIDGRAVRP